MLKEHPSSSKLSPFERTKLEQRNMRKIRPARVDQSGKPVLRVINPKLIVLTGGKG